MYVVGIVMPIILVFTIFIWRLVLETEKREKLALDAAIERTSNNIESIFLEMNQVGIYFSADKELFEVAKESDTDTEFDLFTKARTLENRINIMKWAFPNIDSITLYHNNSRFYDRDDLIYLTDELKASDWYVEYLDTGLNFYYATDYYDQDMHLTLTTRFSDYIDKTGNIIRQAIGSRTLSEALQDNYFNDGRRVYLVNPDHQIMASSHNPDDNLTDVQSISDKDLSKSGKLIINSIDFKSLGDGWQLIYWIDDPNTLNTLMSPLIMLVISMIVVFVLSYFLVHRISHNISRRLSNVASVMKTSQNGTLETVARDSSHDEIGVVSQTYNQLIHQIKKLLTQLKHSKEQSDTLLEEKMNAYEELETTNEELASVNQELTASFEEIEIQDHKIQELIYSDLLTGLHNRFSITSIIEKGISSQTKDLKSIIFIDVDNFKYINDTYGHDIGDEVIKETGKKLMTFEDEHITFGRFGGDEFLVYADGFNRRGQIVTLLERIFDEFKNPVQITDKKFYLTVSMGVALFPLHGRNRNELIKKADMALYQSKNTGKNRYTFFDASFDEGLERRIELQNAIKEAIRNDEFHLNYQPLTGTADGQLKGFEALIRWNSPTLGYVSPYELITVAEEMGAIVEIGEWVIEEALSFIKGLNANRSRKLTISINISAVQLLSRNFTKRLMGIGKAIGVEPSEVCLEMTETVLIDSFTRKGKSLQNLKNEGYGIALDDFGTGYSSLSYFKELPVSILKIDKSFIDELSSSTFNKDLVQVMTVIAHSKKIEVTAEGVETLEQLDILRELNCDTIQGYYISKPLDQQAARAYAEERSHQ